MTENEQAESFFSSQLVDEGDGLAPDNHIAESSEEEENEDDGEEGEDSDIDDMDCWSDHEDGDDDDESEDDTGSGSAVLVNPDVDEEMAQCNYGEAVVNDQPNEPADKRGWVKAQNGRWFRISQVVRNYYGNMHEVRQHSRAQRFYQNELLPEQDPRGFGVETSLIENVVKRGSFVYFAFQVRQRRAKKNVVMVGQVMWFLHPYCVKTKQYYSAMAIATAVNDSVWLKCFQILKRGSLKESRVLFRKVPLSTVNHAEHVVGVSGGKIVEFDKERFLALRGSLLNSLVDAQNLQKQKVSEMRQKRLKDMTLPVSAMNSREVWNECKKRTGQEENGINELSHELSFTSSPSERPLLPALKKLLKHLRLNSVWLNPTGPNQE